MKFIEFLGVQCSGSFFSEIVQLVSTFDEKSLQQTVESLIKVKYTQWYRHFDLGLRVDLIFQENFEFWSRRTNILTRTEHSLKRMILSSN